MDSLPGNNARCERGGPYFITTTETLKQMWPNQPLPLTLLLEAFYLDLKSFELKVGFCPGSILKFNSIAAAQYNEMEVRACNVFFQKADQLPEESKRCVWRSCVRDSAFATKYHIASVHYSDGEVMTLPEPVFALYEVWGVGWREA